MKTINQEGTQKTPAMRLDPATGSIELKGRSIPENSIEFYKPVIEWLEEYRSAAKAETQVHIHLEYFNTSSSKCILDVFKKLEAIQTEGISNVTINWYYDAEDDDMLEAGQDYDSIIRVPFKMIEIAE